MATNPIAFTSRTFDSTLNDINSDPTLRDVPDWIKSFLAGIADVASMMVNAVANDLVLDTSYTREGTQSSLSLIDYYLDGQSTASGTLIFFLKDSVIFPFSVDKSELIARTTGSTSASTLQYEARDSVNVVAVNETFTVDAGANTLTIARVYTTGEKVRLTSTGSLPSPLEGNKDYWVLKVDDTTIRLSSTLANAFAGTSIDLDDTGTGTHTVHLYSIQVNCYQQTQREPVIAGSSDGITEFQSFVLPDVDILQDTIKITINSIEWTQGGQQVDSKSTDLHFWVKYQTDNSAKIEFGDGVYGAIPPAFDVFSEYATGGGAASNVTTPNKIVIYAGEDSHIDGVTNPGPITGGGDPESVDRGKKLGPLLVKEGGQFVTTDNAVARVLAFGGISQAKVIRNAYGVLSSKIVTIANGGGNPDNTTKAALQQDLIDRTVLESIDVRVEDTIITPIAVTSAAKVKDGYLWVGQVENWFRLGWKLFLSEASFEIREVFGSQGVTAARELINTIFSESYTAGDETQIQEFIENLEPSEIGTGEVQESQAFGFLNAHTHGVDHLTITAPSFPITVAADEVTTYGTLTLTEIV
jgi:hypothetical protein